MKSTLTTEFEKVRKIIAEVNIFIRRHYWKRMYSRSSKQDDIIHMSPEMIEYYQLECKQVTMRWRDSRPPVERHELSKGRFQPEICLGAVVDGQWDIYKIPYEFDRVYRGLKSVFDDGEAWENTDYGQRLILQDQTTPDRNSEFDKRVQQNNEIYESMEKNGYQRRNSKMHMISVNIGREGEIIFNNRGHHRLAISRLLGLDSIPVLIVVRHRKWQDIRDQVERKGSVPSKHKGHPDLQPIVS